MKRPIGFTLIELLVVIAIISLLVTILMPSLNRAKELAREVKCLSNARVIALAQMMYASEHDGALIARGDSTRTDGFVDRYEHPAGNMYNGRNSWADVLFWEGLIGNLQVYHCPEDDDPLNFPDLRPCKLSYGVNGYINDDTNLGSVENPISKVFVGETRGNGLHTVGCWSFRAPGIRHSDRGSYIYFDCHAELPTFREVWDHDVDAGIPRTAGGEIDVVAHWWSWYPSPPSGDWGHKNRLNAELFPAWSFWLDN